eukprot:GHVP01066206.1.p1 GENE.GHVP01066206.1~~GHVP01066206.1.p1  ORF type:complete len:137 (+),score=29.56 GHVP01066206.1:85-495(+)
MSLPVALTDVSTHVPIKKEMSFVSLDLASLDNLVTKSISDQSFDVIILNTPLPAFTDKIVRHSNLRSLVCADGGALRLKALCPDVVPNFIIGDLDSYAQDLVNVQTEVIFVKDQDTNDFEKSLNFLSARGKINTKY